MLRLKTDSSKNVSDSMRTAKFANVVASDFEMTGGFSDFASLTRSFEGMAEDRHFGQAKAGTRYRRYSDFEYDPTSRALNQLEHRSYTQSTENNKYVGGLARDFEDFNDDILQSSTIRSLIDTDFDVYKTVLPDELHETTWQCQIHQIRIEIKPGQQLDITPEGIHCDGYPFSGVHFWGRENVAGAESQLFDKQTNLLAKTTYQSILDTTYFLDRELQHYVTPARTNETDKPAYRQIIAISFSKPGTAYDTVR